MSEPGMCPCSVSHTSRCNKLYIILNLKLGPVNLNRHFCQVKEPFQTLLIGVSVGWANMQLSVWHPINTYYINEWTQDPVAQNKSNQPSIALLFFVNKEYQGLMGYGQHRLLQTWSRSLDLFELSSVPSTLCSSLRDFSKDSQFK